MNKEVFDISGKTALVTGSNRGIGKAILLGLAERGADVIVHCRKRDERSEAALREARLLGVRAEIAYADLGEKDGVKQLYSQAINKLGSPDILVLNASVQYRNQWENITDEEFDIQFNVNFRASLNLIKMCIPSMRDKRWGRIITVGSVQQAKPHEEMLVYAAAKMAQMSMVTSLARQLAAYGITINNIAPGAIYTDRNSDVLSDEHYRKKVEDGIPAGFIGQPDDCVAPVIVMCSNEGRYITGTDLFVDGGKHL